MNLNLWKQRKKELHLNYDQIAEMTQLPKSTVTNIFLGYVTTPRIDTVEAIEKALGINSNTDWTEEDKANGVGHYPTYLSAAETDWLELRSLIIEAHGEKYLDTLQTMIKTLANIDTKK